MSGKDWARKHLFSNRAAGRGNGDRPDLAGWLARLTLAPVQQVDELELTPLILEGAAGEPWLLGAEAIDRGLLEIAEQPQATVPTVRATNRADREVLILEGDTLVGCRQNRVVVHTILVAPDATVDVQVGCVEAGRWGRATRHFTSGKLRMDPSVRRATSAEAAAAMRAGARPRVDQARLWQDVAEKLTQQRVSSPTGDYQAYADSSADEAIERASGFVPVRDQIGAVATWRGRLLGLEIVGHPDCWNTLARRTLPTYVVEARDAAGGAPWRPTGASRPAEDWLAALAGARMRVRPAAGLGLDFELGNEAIRGGGVWDGERPAYLSAFSAGPKGSAA